MNSDYSGTAIKEREIELHRDLVRKYRLRYLPEFAQVFHRYWNRLLTRGLIESPDTRVLDCGCGSGVLLRHLNNHVTKSWGIDISADMVKELLDEPDLRKRIVVGDMEKLPFRDGFFDLVVCRGSLHHVPDPRKALSQIRQALRPGGSVVVSEPCNDSIVLRVLRRLLVPRLDNFGHDHKAFRSAELAEIFRDAGFEISSVEYFGYLGFPLCGLADMIPVVRYLPGKIFFAKAFTTIDRVLARIPLVRTLAWHVIVRAENPATYVRTRIARDAVRSANVSSAPV